MVSDTSSDESSSSEDEGDGVAKYGYGTAVHTEQVAAALLNASGHSRAKRFAGSSSPVSRQKRSFRIRKRPSIHNKEDVHNTELPFHPQRMPQRSSLKGSRSSQSGANMAAAAAAAAAAVASDSDSELDEEDLAAVLRAAGQMQEAAKADNGADDSNVIEVQLPGRRGSIKRQRSLRFNEEVNVRNVVPAKFLSKDPEKLWFQDEEYQSIKRKTRALLSRVDSNGIVDGKRYCTRGLERYMVNQAERDGMKYGAWDSVLLEQRLQRKEGIFCDESIAKLYSYIASKSVQDATQQAFIDANEVASFYEQDETMEEAENTKDTKPRLPTRLRSFRRATVA